MIDLKKISLFLAVILAAHISFGQKQHDKWFFQVNATLDFSSGTPVTMPASSMNAIEGSTSIADSCTGDLLFYTDGTTIWDASHAVMVGGSGMMGGPSSVQAAMIIPSRNNPKQYYVFTTDDVWGFNGFRYSVVDMSLPGNGTVPAPLGEVLPGQKNIQLSTTTSERLTAGMHSNCRDIWVLEHGINNTTFKAWLVTPAGVSAAPVVSNVGAITPLAYGSMRLSHNGKKLVLTEYNGTGNNVFMYDFDNTTGTVSNEVNLTAPPATPLNIVYMAEFSPDDQIVYVTHLGGIEQFQVSSPATTQYHVWTNTSGNVGTVQLGPDCKIYCFTSGLTTVGVISNPNGIGAACGLVPNSIPLGPGQQFACGFPNILTWKPKACTPVGFTYSVTPCSFLVQFNDTDCSVKSRTWDFGDPASGGANISTLQNPTHLFSAAGNYSVTVVFNMGGCLTYTVTSVITVASGGLTMNPTSAPTSCTANTGTASVSPGGGSSPYTYAWSPSGGNSSAATGLGVGNYTVNVTDALGCTGTQTFSINTVNGPVASASVTANATCGNSNGSATASVSSGGTAPFTYSWSPAGGASANASGLASGNYTVTVTDANGCTAVQVVTVANIPGPNLVMSALTHVLCNGGNTGSAAVAAAGGTAPYTYLWNPTAAATATATGLAAGNYSVIVTDANGCTSTQSVAITQPTALTATTTSGSGCGPFSGSATVAAGGGAGAYSYSWSPSGGTSSAASGLAAGNYVCTVTDGNGCTTTSTVIVSTYSNPTAAAFSDTSIFEGQSAILTASGGVSYSWTNGLVGSEITVGPLVTSVYCVTVTDSNGCTDTACVTVTVEPIDCTPVSSEAAFYLPNAFSPNSDLENESWRLPAVALFADCVTEFKVEVYNRWGEKVFESTHLGFGWDGNYDLKYEDPAVFAYVMKATLKNGKQIRKRGNISLIR